MTTDELRAMVDKDAIGSALEGDPIAMRNVVESYSTLAAACLELMAERDEARVLADGLESNCKRWQADCETAWSERDAALSVIATAERMAAAGVFPELIEVGQDAGRFVIHFEPATHESYAAAVTAWGEQNPEVRDGE